MHLVAFVCLLALVSPTPKERPLDHFLKDLVRDWTVVVDQRNAEGANLDDLLEALAGNQFFDVPEQSRLHPSYSSYAKDVAARRPSTVDPDRIVAKTIIILGKKNRALNGTSPKPASTHTESAATTFGGMIGILALSFGLPIWWIRYWTRRAERKMTPRNSIGKHYSALLLRMSLRYGVVVGTVSFLAIMGMPEFYTQEQLAVRVLFVFALAFVCLGVVLLYSRTLTKRRFSS